MEEQHFVREYYVHNVLTKFVSELMDLLTADRVRMPLRAVLEDVAKEGVAAAAQEQLELRKRREAVALRKNSKRSTRGCTSTRGNMLQHGRNKAKGAARSSSKASSSKSSERRGRTTKGSASSGSGTAAASAEPISSPQSGAEEQQEQEKKLSELADELERFVVQQYIMNSVAIVVHRMTQGLLRIQSLSVEENFDADHGEPVPSLFAEHYPQQAQAATIARRPYLVTKVGRDAGARERVDEVLQTVYDINNPGDQPRFERLQNHIWLLDFFFHHILEYDLDTEDIGLVSAGGYDYMGDYYGEDSDTESTLSSDIFSPAPTSPNSDRRRAKRALFVDLDRIALEREFEGLKRLEQTSEKRAARRRRNTAPEEEEQARLRGNVDSVVAASLERRRFDRETRVLRKGALFGCLLGALQIDGEQFQHLYEGRVGDPPGFRRESLSRVLGRALKNFLSGVDPFTTPNMPNSERNMRRARVSFFLASYHLEAFSAANAIDLYPDAWRSEDVRLDALLTDMLDGLYKMQQSAAPERVQWLSSHWAQLQARLLENIGDDARRVLQDPQVFSPARPFAAAIGSSSPAAPPPAPEVYTQNQLSLQTLASSALAGTWQTALLKDYSDYLAYYEYRLHAFAMAQIELPPAELLRQNLHNWRSYVRLGVFFFSSLWQ
ncbi:unnamed protein product [Amoebophrya sp. A120]|nr:unnamed protein product [Amoebophrya sp. A120]|eukprot:GSA120T00024101001.1